MYRLGIDVGGTNTDAVIIDENLQVVHFVKVPTSADIATGIHSAMHKVLTESEIDPSKVTHTMLGTTQCTNAIVERKRLAKVGVLRLGYPATASVLPYTAWPEDMVEALSENYALVHGGFEYDGQILTEINEQEIRDVLKGWQGKVEAIAIIGVFSSLKDEQERQVAEIVKSELGDIPISLSATIGSVGLIARENATILNAALFKVIKTTSDGFEQALLDEGITAAETYFCQNDGTLMSVDYARQYPILTIACGPTNSIRGASYLADLQNALILDVGGTTSDIGVLIKGFPRESSLAADVGGVETNFRMPDVLSIGLGGGSLVKEIDGTITIGPESVGYRITDEALVFGGKQLTTTDIAVRVGAANIGDASLVTHIPDDFAKRAIAKIGEMTENAIDKMKTSAQDADLILVGGGSFIIPNNLAGVKQIIRDDKGAVANAIGASIAQISGQFEKIYIYKQMAREAALKDAEANANQQAIAAGADATTLALVEVEEVPLAYHPENATRLRVKVVGDLKK